MNQMTFSDVENSGRKKVTQKEKFLREMEAIIPWGEWVAKIAPHYPAGKRGRPPRGIEVMLRMYLLQIWFSLSDEGLEDAIYDKGVKTQVQKLQHTTDKTKNMSWHRIRSGLLAL